jgi:hypothetical protein
MPAEGSPVCKTLNGQVSGISSYPLYLEGQAVPPFNIAQMTNSSFISSISTGNGRFVWWNRAFFTPNSAGAKVLLNKGVPADLASGAEIGKGGNFGKGESYGLLFTYGNGEAYFHGGGTKSKHRGNFSFTQDNYIGFQFSVAGSMHYGWARLNTTFVGKARPHTVLHVLESGYESAANTSIAAGNCSGEQQADAREKSPADSPNASLGMLALGFVAK